MRVLSEGVKDQTHCLKVYVVAQLTPIFCYERMHAHDTHRETLIKKIIIMSHLELGCRHNFHTLTHKKRQV